MTLSVGRGGDPGRGLLLGWHRGADRRLVRHADLVLVGTLLSLFEVNGVYLPLVQGLMLLAIVGLRTLLVGRRA